MKWETYSPNVDRISCTPVDGEPLEFDSNAFEPQQNGVHNDNNSSSSVVITLLVLILITLLSLLGVVLYIKRRDLFNYPSGNRCDYDRNVIPLT